MCSLFFVLFLNYRRLHIESNPKLSIANSMLLYNLLAFQIYKFCLFNSYYCHIAVYDEDIKIVYNDLFLYLRTKGSLDPKSVVSNRYLLQYIK